VRIETSNAQDDAVLVVHDAHFSRLGGGFSVLGILLTKIHGGLRAAPYFFDEPAVNLDCLVAGKLRGHDCARRVGGLRGRVGRHEQKGQRNDAARHVGARRTHPTTGYRRNPANATAPIQKDGRARPARPTPTRAPTTPMGSSSNVNVGSSE
jgi:hypothetical protein